MTTAVLSSLPFSSLPSLWCHCQSLEIHCHDHWHLSIVITFSISVFVLLSRAWHYHSHCLSLPLSYHYHVLVITVMPLSYHYQVLVITVMLLSYHYHVLVLTVMPWTWHLNFNPTFSHMKPCSVNPDYQVQHGGGVHGYSQTFPGLFLTAPPRGRNQSASMWTSSLCPRQNTDIVFVVIVKVTCIQKWIITILKWF